MHKYVCGKLILREVHDRRPSLDIVSCHSVYVLEAAVSLQYSTVSLQNLGSRLLYFEP